MLCKDTREVPQCTVEEYKSFGRIKSVLIIILYNLSIDDVEEIRKGMNT